MLQKLQKSPRSGENFLTQKGGEEEILRSQIRNDIGPGGHWDHGREGGVGHLVVLSAQHQKQKGVFRFPRPSFQIKLRL